MVGILDGSVVIWIVFLVLYASLIVILSLKIYYLNFVIYGVKRLYHSYQMAGLCKKTVTPIKKSRFILVVLANVTNFSILGVGVYIYTNNVTDFGTFLLGLLLANTVLHMTFYSIMKVIATFYIYFKLVLRWFYPVIAQRKNSLGIFSVWSVVLGHVDRRRHFLFGRRHFMDGKDGLIFVFLFWNDFWLQVTPAESRQWNQECVYLKFYDKHDVWHLLSAPALYFTFMYLMYLDDDICDKPQKDIPVFWMHVFYDLFFYTFFYARVTYIWKLCCTSREISHNNKDVSVCQNVLRRNLTIGHMTT